MNLIDEFIKFVVSCEIMLFIFLTMNAEIFKLEEFFTQVLRTVNERFEDRTLPSASGPVPLADRGSNAILTIQNLEDLIIHVLDVSSNISIFLVCFPPASDFLNNENFINE